VREEKVRERSMARSSGIQASTGLILMAMIFCTLLLPSVSWAVCACGGDDGIPLVYSPTAPITADGDMADWGTPSQAGTVLGDQDNNVCDGPSGGLTDLDAPIQSTGRDIVQFSYTYDDTFLYFYTERIGSSKNTQTFLYYADVDDDGFQEDGEPVIVAEWKGNNRSVNIYIADYNPVDAINGDSTVDSAGFGDGYALPGNLKNISGVIGTSSGTYGSSDGMAMEFGIEWTELGFSGPVGHTIHVSSTNANKNAGGLGAQIDDNLGGCGGGAGTTQFADLLFSGAYSLQGARASSVYEFHRLVNLGNGDDSFAFAYTRTGTHLPTVTLYLDDGDAIYDTGDSVIAGTVAVASGASVDIITVYGIGSSAMGLATVTTTATSLYSLTQAITIADSVTDTVWVTLPDIVLLKSTLSAIDIRAFNSINAKSIPGAAVSYQVLVTNTGDGSTNTDTVFLQERIPAGTELYVGDGTASPVIFANSGSGLTYSFSTLGSGGDDLAFTSDSGAAPAYTFTPTGDADGYDSAVTGFQVNPKGIFLPAPGSAFNIQYNLRVR
jgi:hypothetical protein